MIRTRLVLEHNGFYMPVDLLAYQLNLFRMIIVCKTGFVISQQSFYYIKGLAFNDVYRIPIQGHTFAQILTHHWIGLTLKRTQATTQRRSGPSTS